MEKFFKWIDKNKNKDKPLILLFKFIYSLTNDWVNIVINIVLPLFVSVFFEKGNIKMFFITFIIYVVIELIYAIVSYYKVRESKNNKDSNILLEEVNIIINTIDNYVSNKDSYDGIFEHASDLVSASIYNTLTRIMDSEIRVSIVQQFRNNGKRSCVMLSRNSKVRQKCSKTIKRVKYEKNKDYYYLKVLEENKENMIIFNEKQIKNNFIYKNKDRKSKIKQYLCIPDKFQSDDVVYLLQLDAMKENLFGKNREEIDRFYDEYIYPYVCILRHAYNIERTLKKKDGEINE